jgi:RNA polymerase sigma factor (sigma-70 family)
VLYERLVSRDGWTHDQAFEMLRVDHGVEELDAITALANSLSKRTPGRRTVREDEANAIESPALRPDTDILRAEQERLADRLHTALDRAQHALPAEDALILKMRFEDAMPIAEIARALDLNQKRLYRSIQRLLTRLRASLERQGISRADVRALIAFE